MCRRHFTVVATIVLFFLFCFLPQPEINIDLALEDALKHHLALLIDSDSARRIRAIQTSLLPPKYPRNLKFTDVYTPEHIARACTTLRAKKILLVGPEPTYYLHSLWLRAIELHEHTIHECPGPEFCTFHHICCPPTQHTTSVITRDRVKHPPRDADPSHHRIRTSCATFSLPPYSLRWTRTTRVTPASSVDPCNRCAHEERPIGCARPEKQTSWSSIAVPSPHQ
ncbi:hypothetical protein C8J57DRAFT_1707667 [Mycena rebaudengoi]|nr:hypothetical protein C8J57DRAFT_1707667 [Mycena rebaudengoi]